MDDVVGGAGDDIFLGQGFQTVSQRLKQPIGSDSIGAITVLKATQSLTLEDSCNCKQGGKHHNDGYDGKRCSGDWVDCGGQIGHEPVLYYYEYLINHFCHWRSACVRSGTGLQDGG